MLFIVVPPPGGVGWGGVGSWRWQTAAGYRIPPDIEEMGGYWTVAYALEYTAADVFTLFSYYSSNIYRLPVQIA